MKIYCTACSAQKNDSPGLLPALMRYRSQRIKSAFNLSKYDKVGFRILSGRFGLLAPQTEIPDYDHPLLSEQVVSLAKVIEGQIEREGIGKIVFFAPDPALFPGWGPYYHVLELACASAGCEFIVEQLESE